MDIRLTTPLRLDSARHRKTRNFDVGQGSGDSDHKLLEPNGCRRLVRAAQLRGDRSCIPVI
jgi:hypothetical protein